MSFFDKPSRILSWRPWAIRAACRYKTFPSFDRLNSFFRLSYSVRPQIRKVILERDFELSTFRRAASWIEMAFAFLLLLVGGSS